jgi:hypothetical protein
MSTKFLADLEYSGTLAASGYRSGGVPGRQSAWRLWRT